MIQSVKVIPVVALVIAVLAPTDAAAKVPFRANDERAPKVTEVTTAPTTTPHRYRKVGHVDATPKAVCLHTHRHSKQHRM